MEPVFCQFIVGDTIFWCTLLVIFSGWVRFALTVKTGKWPQLPFDPDKVKINRVGGLGGLIVSSVLLFIVIQAKYLGTCAL